MANRHRLVPATCIECGAEFLARSDSVKIGLGKTCSRKCGGQRGLREARKIFPTPSLARLRAQIRASGLINMRIRRGKLTRPDRCSNCGKQGLVDAHHEDYEKPAEIEWLCRSCHMKRHFGRERLTA